MFADLSHPTASSLPSRLAQLFSRLSHAFEVTDSWHLTAELRRLSDHQLRDIGIDPRSIRGPSEEAALTLKLLQREWP